MAAIESRVGHPLLENDAASAWLGIEVLRLDDGHATIAMTLRPEMMNGFGITHGGMIFAFADSAFALACNPADGDGSTVTVKGAKGELTRTVHSNMAVEVEGATVHVKRPDDTKLNKSLHGLTRTLVANMVTGVSEGYKKELEINGVGYRAAKEGKELVLNIGFSHQVRVAEIDGITIEVPAPNKIVISGPDKQKVGQFAAEVREKRPPEPYKGKGIKYVDEHIRRKEGKAGKGGK